MLKALRRGAWKEVELSTLSFQLGSAKPSSVPESPIRSPSDFSLTLLCMAPSPGDSSGAGLRP